MLAQNDFPACAVGPGHHVTVTTVAFLSGLCVTNRTFKIEGLFYSIVDPSPAFFVVFVDQRGEEVGVKVLVLIRGYASTKMGTME